MNEFTDFAQIVITVQIFLTISVIILPVISPLCRNLKGNGCMDFLPFVHRPSPFLRGTLARLE